MAIRKKKPLTKSALLRKENFELWKARQLRSSFLTRLKKVAGDQYKTRMVEVPTASEIESWLHTCKPYVCVYSQDEVPEKSLEVDHDIPISREGSFSLDNLVATSKLHNRAKGDLTGEEYRQFMKLLQTWPEKAYWSVLNRLIQSTYIYRKKKR